MISSSSSQNLYGFPASSSANLYTGSTHGSMSFPTSSGVSLAGPSQLTIDPYSPEKFNDNIKMAIGYVDLISGLAKSTIDGIEQVFHISPEANHLEVSKNLEMLRQYIEMLTVHLASSGVGALPIITFPPDGGTPTIPSEATLLEETSKAVNVLYARQKQIQENSGTVASLLSAPESSRR